MEKQCEAITTSGQRCSRDRMNDTIPYCWQHSRQMLEKLMWGLDKLRDEEGELTPDDLTPEQVLEQFSNCSERIQQLEDALESQIEECNELLNSANGRATIAQLAAERYKEQLLECEHNLQNCTQNCVPHHMHQAKIEELEECKADKQALERALDDCEEELDDSQLMPEDMPTGGTHEEDSPTEGTFPEDDDADGISSFSVGNLGSFYTLQQCPSVISEDELYELEPPGSVGIFICPDVELSGVYDNFKKYIGGTAANINLPSGDNYLKEYFEIYDEDSWSPKAEGSWVKKGDWFFFKNSADDMWYGNVISKTQNTLPSGHLPSDPYCILHFEKEYEMANLGENVEFAIVIFEHDSK